MGLGHARGVLDLHRGYFRFFSGETAKTIVDARWTEVFLAMDVDNGQSRVPLALGIFFLVHFFTYEHGSACFLL